MSAELIFDDQLARELGLSLDQIYEQARLGNLPFAVSTVRPRRLFIPSPGLARVARCCASIALSLRACIEEFPDGVPHAQRKSPTPRRGLRSALRKHSIIIIYVRCNAAVMSRKGVPN
jgi:hypothetical protein